MDWMWIIVDIILPFLFGYFITFFIVLWLSS